MKIAFLTDPLVQFKTYKDTTFAMMREAARRGYSVYAFGAEDLALESGQVVARIRHITLTGDEHDWFRADAAVTLALSEFDAVLQRKDPPFDMEYIYATYLLEIAERAGARVFNKSAAIRNNNEKLSITGYSQFTTPTLVTRDEQRIRDFQREHEDIILKPLDGMGGAGIFRIRADAMNLGSVIETLTLNGSRTIMVQRYIPEIVDGDKRILLIGGKVVPFALARIPQNGEVRGNLAAGGLGVAQELSARDLEIAQTLAPELYQKGLLLVGLDVIGSCLTEINVTSPTCFQEITTQKGFDVAAMFIDALEVALTEAAAG
ncbi:MULTISPECIES: glutathione synthase [unclassified Undibacterium]|uniref:glutathione synthase n=1 Tax=unclassified Undibacterium TaxID=2630295 RepID=UPI002AC928DA|nr:MULTISPECIES: glutathione synthase [unclassified Undibacterium]MEB0138900.1 glutathione synthase [Undibacterium sp. CCC2.1]MEB0171769.1 glutathione synthase [Undibacterium sp. CCC1.1]MEB0175531.1 glutathione synthase [Undibacterium sp. CCC3.4]MEB0214971.1 glutathione synthase [Undibacterium sp. 5I2]WPX44952.1 glutathione synthase [Undibacterium sp. CCC3.4]